MPTSGVEFSHLKPALAAVAALERQLFALLACADVLTTTGHPLPAAELRRALMRAISVLRALQEEMACIQIIADVVARQLQQDAAARREN